MPAKSRSQQKAAGVARAIQKGEMKAKPGTASAAMAKMPAKSLKDYAGTSHKGLPEHKESKAKLSKGLKSRFSR